MLICENVPIRHTSGCSQDCLSSLTNPQENNSESIARELLTYLGHFPTRIHKNEVELAELALMVGNALVWIHHWMEPGKPEVENAIGENPQTVFALGKQFQAVGRAQLGKGRENVSKTQYQGLLKLVLENSEQLDSIENTLNLIAKGTKK